MIVIIPLGGLGTRFKQYGYKLPKPLINVMGKPILFWLLDNLDFKNIDKIVIPYNSELSKYNLENRVRHAYPDLNFAFLELKEQTGGAAETLMISIDNCIDSNKDYVEDCPVLCLDGDNFYTTNITDKWINGENKNCVFCFEDNSDSSNYSYLEVVDNQIVDIVEKEKISRHASTGAYGFESWKTLYKFCKTIIVKDIRQKNEFYTSNVIKEMIADNHTFIPRLVNQENWICLGTPLDVRIFCNNYPRISAISNQITIKPKRMCFDLDNTLVSHPLVPGDYSTVDPIVRNINMVRYLKKLGHTIIIYTARRMRTHNGNVGKIVADVGKVTLDTLGRFDIPYDEIYFGKPYADVYVDDLAISAYDDLEKELGFYQSTVVPRDFNSITSYSVQIYKKQCKPSDIKADTLEGEIKWYQNIPLAIKDIFPVMFNCDTTGYQWYEMEKVNGITATHLLLSENLNMELLGHIIGSIKRIHQCSAEVPSSRTVNIYANYREKLVARYNSYDYSRFPRSGEVFEMLETALNEYERGDKGIRTIIHGDPVLTNVLVNNFGKIKFIDMRGKVGSHVTMFGDALYDWAKLFQSLLGYDEILEEKRVSSSYKNELIGFFKAQFIENYGSEYLPYLITITASLVFTLIPLHDNEKCTLYYNDVLLPLVGLS